jgi:hypothetical protein
VIDLTCPRHGALVQRPDAQQTPEQRWCGTWYDCPGYQYGGHRCGRTVLVPSAELQTQLGTEREAG